MNHLLVSNSRNAAASTARPRTTCNYPRPFKTACRPGLKEVLDYEDEESPRRLALLGSGFRVLGLSGLSLLALGFKAEGLGT